MNTAAIRNIPTNVDDNTNYRDWKSGVSLRAFPAFTAYSNPAAFQAALNLVRAPLTARFRRLADQWAAETENMSSIEDMTLHSAYQEIIGMGPAAIPLLLDELERAPNHWFAALNAVSGGQNPIAQDDAGDMDKMTAAWLEWAEDRGYR